MNRRGPRGWDGVIIDPYVDSTASLIRISVVEDDRKKANYLHAELNVDRNDAGKQGGYLRSH